MVLFDVLRVELEDHDAELVAWDEAALRKHPERRRHNGLESEIRRRVRLINELQRLEPRLIKRARREKHLIRWHCLDIRDERL